MGSVRTPYLPAMPSHASRTLRWWQIPYSIWAIACFFGLVLPIGCLGYGLFSLTPSKGRERRMFYTNNFLAVFWGTLCGVRYRVIDGHFQHQERAFVLAPQHTAHLRSLSPSHLSRIPLLRARCPLDLAGPPPDMDSCQA